jgi:uncharacterized protein YutE (UPF0331/DUF86 family)
MNFGFWISLDCINKRVEYVIENVLDICAMINANLTQSIPKYDYDNLTIFGRNEFKLPGENIQVTSKPISLLNITIDYYFNLSYNINLNFFIYI